MPDMVLNSLTAAANGSLRPGDVLVKVGNEDVSTMPMSRGECACSALCVK